MEVSLAVYVIVKAEPVIPGSGVMESIVSAGASVSAKVAEAVFGESIIKVQSFAGSVVAQAPVHAVVANPGFPVAFSVTVVPLE